jgi:hypothetical protein
MAWDCNEDNETIKEKVARLRGEIQREEDEALRHEATRLEARLNELRAKNEKDRGGYDDRF